MAYTPTTPFGLPIYTGTVLPGQPATTSLRPPAIDQGNPMNPHAYAQADAIQALKQSFKPKPYMPWFAQQAPAANWAKTYNTQAWMPPWVMAPGTVGTGGTNLGLGGMFGYTGNYGPSPGPGINGSTTGPAPGGGLTQPQVPTWGGFPTANPLQIRAVPPATLPGTRPTTPVIQQPNGTYQPGTDPNTGPGLPLPKPDVNAIKGVVNSDNDLPPSMMRNPIPPPRTQPVPQGTGEFLDSFRYSSPTAGSPQAIFNTIADDHGMNTAWTWALHNAWNQLGGYGDTGLRGLMDKAGVPSVEQSRFINTFGGGTNDLGGNYREDLAALGNPFDPNSEAARYRAMLAAYGNP